MSLPRAGVLLLALALGLGALAQGEPMRLPTSDAELWLSTGFERRFYKEKKKGKKERTAEQLERDSLRQDKLMRSFKYKFRLTGELGYRGDENLTSSKLLYTVLGARYRVHEYLRFTMEYRYNMRDKYTSNTGRIDLQADSEVDFGRLNLGYRLVYQHEFVPPIRYRDIVRNRFSLTWKTDGFDIDPYASLETFSTFHYTGSRLIGMRYGAGAQWSITKDHTLDLSLRHDREQNMPELKNRWIVGIAYEYKWKPK